MSDASGIYAPARLRAPSLHSLRDVATLLAVVLAVAIVAHLAAPRAPAGRAPHIVSAHGLR